GPLRAGAVWGGGTASRGRSEGWGVWGAISGPPISNGRDELEVGLVTQARARVCRVGPEHLVHFVVVLADLLERAHAIPAHRLPDALAVALKPVGHRLQLAHDLALPARLFAHLAQGGVGGRLAGIERALGQRPHGLIAEIASADEQHAAPLVDDETAGGELEQRVRPRRGPRRAEPRAGPLPLGRPGAARRLAAADASGAQEIRDRRGRLSRLPRRARPQDARAVPRRNRADQQAPRAARARPRGPQGADEGVSGGALREHFPAGFTPRPEQTRLLDALEGALDEADLVATAPRLFVV